MQPLLKVVILMGHRLLYNDRVDYMMPILFKNTKMKDLQNERSQIRKLQIEEQLNTFILMR